MTPKDDPETKPKGARRRRGSLKASFSPFEVSFHQFSA